MGDRVYGIVYQTFGTAEKEAGDISPWTLMVISVHARVLIKARIEKGLTQAEIAKRMHTKQSVISRVENAKTVPSLSFLKRLAHVLDATLQVQFKF